MGRARPDSESCVHSLPGRDMRGCWWSCFRPHRMKGALGPELITPGLEPKWGRQVSSEQELSLSRALGQKQEGSAPDLASSQHGVSTSRFALLMTGRMAFWFSFSVGGWEMLSLLKSRTANPIMGPQASSFISAGLYFISKPKDMKLCRCR